MDIGDKLALWWAAAVLVAMLATGAHASISHKHQNSLGAVIDDLNPYVYLIGIPTSGTVFECDKDEICTNVLFQPYGADLLHTESVTFCGNEGESILNGPQAIVYRRVATRYYGGIGCHDLEKVFTIGEEKQ